MLGSDSLSGGESDLAELGDDLIGDMRVKLFSDAIAPSASEPAAADPSDPAGITTVVGESANELLVDARLTLRTAAAKGTVEAAVDRAFDEANRDAVSEKLDQFLNGKARPEISWASFNDSQVQGAFIAETNTILISEELQGSNSTVQAVVLEEIGHWLESENDSAGDEGERFATQIVGDKSRIDAAADNATLVIDSVAYAAELAAASDTGSELNSYEAWNKTNDFSGWGNWGPNSNNSFGQTFTAVSYTHLTLPTTPYV